MALYRDQGVVLRTYKLGEADRIIVLMTRRNGKVRAVAKGIRKTKSKFGARLEPTSHVSLQLYEGRELDIVTQVETIDVFRPIREDLDHLGRAASMLEAVDKIAIDREPTPKVYDMLVGALRALGDTGSPLVAPAFFCKLLSLEGYRPQVEVCVRCGTEGDLVSFDANEGGLLCPTDRRGIPVSPEAVERLRQILGGRLAAALEQAGTPADFEVERVATTMLEHHLERRLVSVGLLDRG